jgi:hypothetical protein
MFAAQDGFDVVQDRYDAVGDSTGQPVRPAERSRRRRAAQVLAGCCFLVLGAWKLCHGLLLLTDASNSCTVMKVNNADVYYTRAVSQAEAQALGDFLVRAKLFDGSQRSVQLTREGRTVQIRFPVNRGAEKDPACIALAREIATQAARDVFRGSPVEVDLCDANFNTLSALPATLAK